MGLILFCWAKSEQSKWDFHLKNIQLRTKVKLILFLFSMTGRNFRPDHLILSFRTQCDSKFDPCSMNDAMTSTVSWR